PRIAPERLEDPFAEIEASQELTVVRNLVRHLGDVPGIGLEAGRRYRLTAYGIWGYALLSSRTLRSAVEFGIRYLDLTFAFNRFRAESAPNGLRIVLDDRDIPEECAEFLVERDAAAAVAIQRDLFLRPVPLQRVSFRFPPPAYADRFPEYFPGPVYFDEPAHGVVVATEWLDQPLPQADERTARLCEEQCRALLDRRRARTRVSEQVRQHLLRPRAVTGVARPATAWAAIATSKSSSRFPRLSSDALISPKAALTASSQTIRRSSRRKRSKRTRSAARRREGCIRLRP